MADAINIITWSDPNLSQCIVRCLLRCSARPYHFNSPWFAACGLAESSGRYIYDNDVSSIDRLRSPSFSQQPHSTCSTSSEEPLITPMVENSDDPKILDRIRSRAHASKNHSPGPRNQRLRSDQAVDDPEKSNNAGTLAAGRTSGVSCHDGMSYAKPKSEGIADETSSTSPDHAPPPASENRPGATSSAIELELKPNWAVRFYHTLKEIMFSSIINVLLVFVPVGIAVKFAGVNPTIVFAMNAVAIIPLAGLLSHATESVANSMGDTVGALMNVTFGNAVELIIL